MTEHEKITYFVDFNLRVIRELKYGSDIDSELALSK
jgi:hypothetical protein